MGMVLVELSLLLLPSHIASLDLLRFEVGV